jgi:hypothetical protein
VVALMAFDSANYGGINGKDQRKTGVRIERKGPLNATQIQPQSQLKSFDCDKCKDKFFNNMYINRKCIM